MAKNKHQDAFWLSYSDLMTSLFFIVLVLLIVSLSKIKSDSLNLEIERNEANARKEKLAIWETKKLCCQPIGVVREIPRHPVF